MIETYNGITLIGTAHISKHSATLVEKTIKAIHPNIVAVELDSMRLQKLLQDEKENQEFNSLSKEEQKKYSKKKQKTNSSKLIKQIGLFGYLFLKIAGFMQQKMGKAFHIEPGVDMLAGVHMSKELDIPLCLADRPILHTIAEFKKLSFLTKMSMVKRMVFTKMSFEEKKELAQKIQNDKLDEKTILTIISTLKDEVPELYEILIHKRNQYMVSKLIGLKKQGFEKIVIVIGAGHLPGMLELLHEQLPTVEEEIKKEPSNSNTTQLHFKIE
ncbi:MAG: TraB domain-containing protein [Nanoarchaeota archaeon]|nr:TraB domain-containing protein [Nanoarchaeota archaeon]